MTQITKDMTIQQILTEFPEHSGTLTEVMLQAGLHCVGCGAASFETLEQGVMGHGKSVEQLESLLTQLNNVLNSSKEQSVDGPVIRLTDTAVSKIKEMMADEADNTGLKISVQSGGCAGWTYEMAFQQEASGDEMEIEQDGVRLFVSKDNASKLQGTEVSYVTSLQKSGFTFDNPNAQTSCGCGQSFG